MNKVEWFSSQELEALKLPAIAGSQRRIRSQAEREQWKSRPRSGNGGGSEYYIGSLPEAARIELARRALTEISSTDLHPSSSLSGSEDNRPSSSRPVTALPLASSSTPRGQRGGKAFLSATKAGSRAQTRASARLVIINMLRSFSEAGGLSQTAARASFAALFNAGEITVEEWVQTEVGSLTMRSLERWASQAARDGALRLGGKYGHRKGKGAIEGDPTLRDFCIMQMAARPHLTAQQLVDFIRAAHGKEIPRRTVQRFMATAKVDHAEAFLAASNPDAWKNKKMIAFGSKSESVQEPNKVWEIDASPADVLCIDPATGKPRRYNLVGMIDVATRRAKILVSETPKATAATLLLRRCIMDWGVPTILKTDNGKDFVSAHMARALGALMIEQKPCAPFTPEGKPHIERFFGTLQRDCTALLPGFIGHNVTDRKAIEARRSFADRLGEGDKLIEVTLSHEELQERIDDWIEYSYHRAKHSGLGTTPMLKLVSWTGSIARIENQRALDVLLAEAPDTEGTRVVTKKGLRVENANFIARELVHHVGERVQVRLDPEDMGRIVIYSIDGEFICVAECPERSGANRQEIAMIAKAEQRELQKENKRVFKALSREHKPHTIVDDVMRMKKADASQVVHFPGAGGTSEKHSTPALDAAALAARRLAGVRDEPRPVSDEERELAAEAMTALSADNIITLPKRNEKPSDEKSGDIFGSDWDFYLYAIANWDELKEGQRGYFEEIKDLPEIQVRIAQLKEAEENDQG